MPIIITGNNLNQYGNAGQFETDRSTWGFSNQPKIVFSRSSTAKSAGIYSCLAAATDTITTIGSYPLATARFYMESGKKYRVTCKVLADASAPFADGTAIIRIQNITSTGSTETVVFSSTIAAITGNPGDPFITLETRITAAATGYYNIPVLVDLAAAESINIFGQIYLDQMEVYEYTDQVGPTCNLDIDGPGSTVTEATAGNSDGSITVAITGAAGAVEYSIDGGNNWQASNQFTGLAAGIYTIQVRETANLSCTDSYPFSINEDTIDFSFTLDITDETVIGEADGQIEITVTGTSGPYTFSKDGGSTYQASNIFSGLAPGNYSIVVKDSVDDTLSTTAQVLPGVSSYSDVYLSKNPISFTFNETANAALDNYQIYLEIRVEDIQGSGQFIKKMALAMYPDGGKITANIRQAFRGCLKAIPPDPGSAQITRLTDRIKLFKVYHGDIYEDLTIPDTLTGSLPFQVLLGGLNKFHYGSTDFFSDYLTNQKKFLTWQPIEKSLDKDQEDYLSYYVLSDTITELNLMTHLFYDDGTDEIVYYTGASAIQRGELYQIPAGVSNMAQLAQDPNKILVKYQLWLEDQNDVIITEVMTYTVIQYRHPNTRHLMFLNSLGQYDTIRITGFTETESNVDKMEIQRYLADGYDPQEGEYQSYNASKRISEKVSTGYFTGKYAAYWGEYLQELAISPQVYEITNGQRKPKVIEPDTFRIRQDQDSRYFIRFTMNDGFSDDVFSPTTLPILGE